MLLSFILRLSAFVFLLLTALTSRVSFQHIVLQSTLHNNIWYSFLIFFQDKFKKKAEDRAREDAALDEPKPYVKPVQRDNLRQRDFKVDVAAGVGKTRLISSVKDKRSPLFKKKLNDPSKLPLLNVFYLWQPCGGACINANMYTLTRTHQHVLTCTPPSTDAVLSLLVLFCIIAHLGDLGDVLTRCATRMAGTIARYVTAS